MTQQPIKFKGLEKARIGKIINSPKDSNDNNESKDTHSQETKTNRTDVSSSENRVTSLGKTSDLNKTPDTFSSLIAETEKEIEELKSHQFSCERCQKERRLCDDAWITMIALSTKCEAFNTAKKLVEDAIDKLYAEVQKDSEIDKWDDSQYYYGYTDALSNLSEELGLSEGKA